MKIAPLYVRFTNEAEFRKYLTLFLYNKGFSPKGVTIHHTWLPDLAMRPDGLTLQHCKNLNHYYQVKKGWSAGPHMFADDHGVWVLYPLNVRGVHAVSFNASHIAIEMLGNFDVDSPDNGRGRKVVENTRWAVAAILDSLKLPRGAFNFHRDDPKTDKTCPGDRITRAMFLDYNKHTEPMRLVQEQPKKRSFWSFFNFWKS